MKIGFITVSFHSTEDTLGVVKQLEKNTLPLGVTSLIYVVDNDKSSELEEKLEKYPQAIYVASPGNIGFAAGNNRGIRKALADEVDILVMINNDTLIPEDLILKILASPIVEKTTGAVGGLIYFAKGFEFEKKYQKKDLGKVIWYAGGEFDWNNVYAKHIGVNEIDKGQYNGQRETDFITGCLFITKAEVLNKVGLFDERYCLYLEDSDLGLRIKKAGLQLIFDSNIKISHKVAQSSAIGSPLNDYFITRNRLLFGMDYAKPRTKFALLREAIKKLLIGTKAQKQAVRDFYMRKLGLGFVEKLTMQKLSVIILAKNVAHEIIPAIKTSQFASEVIIVDTGSTDNTIEICRKLGAKIIHSTGDSFSKWRNDGAKEAKGEWLLYLDSDERIPVKLADEIMRTIEFPTHDAYTISRYEIFLGKHLKHWGDPRVLRLMKKSALKRWEGKLHEQPKIKGTVGDIRHQMVHLSHKNIDEKVPNTLNWSKFEAKLLLDAGHPPMKGWRFIRIMLTEFWYRTIKQGLWRDGTEGWIEIIYQMFSKFMTYERLWEAHRKPSLADTYKKIDDELLQELHKENK